MPHRLSFFILLPILALCYAASPAHARTLVPEQPSVEINLDVLQYLSDPAAAFGAAPVDDVSAGELGGYQPQATRKVPEENPYNPPVRQVAKRAQPPVAQTGGAPFYHGKSPAARIEQRNLPRPSVSAKKETAPKPKPVQTAKKETPPPPKPVVKAAPKPPPMPVVKAAPKPPPEPVPPPVPAPVDIAASEMPVDLPEVNAPPPLPIAPEVLAPSQPQVAQPAPEVLVKRDVPNNPMALPLPNFPSNDSSANVAELTAVSPEISQKVQDAFAPPPSLPGGELKDTRRIINPVEEREKARAAAEKAQEEAPAANEPPPLNLALPGSDMPDLPPPSLPSMDSLTTEPGGLELAALDDQIFATDPMAGAGMEAPSAEVVKENQQKFASLDTPSRGEVGLGKVGSAELSVGFQPNMQDLPDAEKQRLTELADKVRESQGSINIVAYAGGTPDQASMARRVSLSRALSVRAFLIDKGVEQLRINVQAKGNKDAGDNPDRADIFVK